MTHKQIDSRVFALLESSADLHGIWTRPPEIAHLPFMGKRESFFLLVNIPVRSEWTDRKQQVKDCLAIAQAIIRSSLLEDEKGIEVAAWFVKFELKKIVERSGYQY
jgi:hypothetical protein